MELGNMIFGHSRGEVEMPRSKGFEDELERLWEAINPKNASGYGEHFENDVFASMPYYWGDCACGFDERWEKKQEQWHMDNKHSPECYQSKLKLRMLEYDVKSGYKGIQARAFPDNDPLLGSFDIQTTDHGNGCVSFVGAPRTDDAMESWRAAHDKRKKVEDALYKELCREFQLPARGCAVHCTCDYEKKWSEFASGDDHDSKCPIVRPNFLFKPTGYTLMWYKYPLRDAYSSRKMKLVEFSKMVDACIVSIQGHKT